MANWGILYPYCSDLRIEMKTLEQRKKQSTSIKEKVRTRTMSAQNAAERDTIRSILRPTDKEPSVAKMGGDRSPTGLRLKKKPAKRTRSTGPTMNFPDWLPGNVREDIKKRYQRGDFSVPNLPQVLPEESKGIVQKYPGIKPYGQIYAWVGRSEFLNQKTREPDISFQFYQELPEETSFWRSYFSEKGVSDVDFKVRAYTGYAIKANCYMRVYLEQGLSVEIAKQKTLQAFDNDVKIIVSTLLGSGL